MTCRCPEDKAFKCDRCKQEFCVECMHLNVLNTHRNLCCSCREMKHLFADWLESMLVYYRCEIRTLENEKGERDRRIKVLERQNENPI